MHPRSAPLQLATAFRRLACLALCGSFLSLGRGASLQVFATVFGLVTNQIAEVEAQFDDSVAEKQRLATLVHAKTILLDPGIENEAALASLVELLRDNDDYDAVLDDAAANLRALVLSAYHLVATRAAELPPSARANHARARFEAVTRDAVALEEAPHAVDISTQLAPFEMRLAAATKYVERAAVMPRPNVRLNSVRAVVNGRAFSSAGDGAHSPNLFSVTAPSPLYREVLCRVVDGERMISFTLPVMTRENRYTVASGLATVTYDENVFRTDESTVQAVDGIFFMQASRTEIFGVFACTGPGLDITNGRVRIALPRELRNAR